MRLLGVELTRLRWRRAVVVLLAAMVVLPVVIAVITILGRDAPGVDEALQRDAERQAAIAVQDCLEDPELYLGELPEGTDVQQACEDSNDPSFFYYDNRLDLAGELEGGGFAAAVVVSLLALLAGTTFVGHDWNTGSMGNQLLFVPRRMQVWSAKAVAVALAKLVTTAVGMTSFWLVLAARFWTSGTDIPSGLLLDGLQQGWRAAGVAAAAAVLGYAITMLSRSTVFTLGVLFGVSVAGGILIGLLVDDPAWVDPTINAHAVISDGATYYVDVPDSCFSGPTFDETGECDSERTRELGDGLIYLGLLGAVAVTGSTLSFRRRDVP